MRAFCGSGAGKIPDSGAIFMSNRSTKEECLSRKLLGLPLSFFDFVKHVRVGMLLFLFEHERRLLYGVFQAVSDGSMDIVPHAFQSSGKRYPAQVQFDVFWKCRPIPESSFRDAIKDNYFGASKFNFGLCREQVLRLLLLFDSQRVIPHINLRGQRAVSSEETHPDAKSSSSDVNEHEELDDKMENTAVLPTRSETDDEFIPLSTTYSSDSEGNLDEVAPRNVAKGLYSDNSVRKSVFSRLKLPREAKNSTEIKTTDPVPRLKRKRTKEGNDSIEAATGKEIQKEAFKEEKHKEKVSKKRASALSRLRFPPQ